MPKKTFTIEQIISKPREAEVLLSQGQTVPAACKVIGVAEQTYNRWRKSYGGLKIEQAQRLLDDRRQVSGSQANQFQDLLG